MKNSIQFLLIFTILVSCLSSAFSKASNHEIHYKVFNTQIKEINFSVDPRIELFQSVMLLAGNPLVNSADLDYKIAILKRFAPYQSHPLFGFIKKYGPQGKLFTSIDAPIWYMLHLTPEMEWRKNLENPYSHQPLMDSLRILLKSFAAESHYDEFFNSNADLYRLTLASMRLNLADLDEKRRLLNYYGSAYENQTDFNVILNFLGFGNFGPQLKNSRGKEFYAVICANGNNDQTPTFDRNGLYGLLWHEFGHSFANPLIQEHIADFEKLSSLWGPIKTSMQFQAYYEWKVVLWEHLTNAVMCRLAADKFGEDYADVNYVRPLLGKRWIYLNVLLAALKNYEENRTAFPTLRSFMPKIIESFRNIQPSDIEKWQEKTIQIRKPDVAALPNLGDIDGKENVLFIVSTGEADREGDALLQTFIKDYRLKDFPSAKVVGDTLALKMDLSSYNLFVIGTPWGNRFLNKVMKDIPVKISRTEVIAGKKYEGTGYVWMSGWVNPFDIEKIMVIYTAQNPGSLVNFTGIPRGGTHYQLVKDFITIKSQNYQRWDQIWQCQ